MKLIIILLLFIILIIYLYYEDNFLQVTNYEVTSEKIPSDFNDYKIIQITDFHNTKSKKLNQDLVNTIKLEQPNIIVITGDFIDANRTDVDVAINLATNLIDIAPIYYVPGNHEASSKKYKELKERLISSGVTILDNKMVTLSKGNSEIELIGVKDPKFTKSKSKFNKETMTTALNNIGYSEDKYKILLSHRPELFEIYVEKQIELVFTGHAHGGQIRIPFIGGIIAPNQGFFPKYTSGTFKENNTEMIISRGLGNSKFPFRVNNRPELVIVKLKV